MGGYWEAFPKGRREKGESKKNKGSGRERGSTHKMKNSTPAGEILPRGAQGQTLIQKEKP